MVQLANVVVQQLHQNVLHHNNLIPFYVLVDVHYHYLYAMLVRLSIKNLALAYVLQLVQQDLFRTLILANAVQHAHLHVLHLKYLISQHAVVDAQQLLTVQQHKFLTQRHVLVVALQLHQYVLQHKF